MSVVLGECRVDPRRGEGVGGGLLLSHMFWVLLSHIFWVLPALQHARRLLSTQGEHALSPGSRRGVKP